MADITDTAVAKADDTPASAANNTASDLPDCIIVSSNLFADIKPYATHTYYDDVMKWGSIVPWEFPQYASKEQEEAFLRQHFSETEIHMQGGAHGSGAGFRFLKQVWYTIALWNLEVRIPGVAAWWFEQDENKSYLQDDTMVESICSPEAKPETFFQSAEIKQYGTKLLGFVVKNIQYTVKEMKRKEREAMNDRPLAATSNVQTASPTELKEDSIPACTEPNRKVEASALELSKQVNQAAFMHNGKGKENAAHSTPLPPHAEAMPPSRVNSGEYITSEASGHQYPRNRGFSDGRRYTKPGTGRFQSRQPFPFVDPNTQHHQVPALGMPSPRFTNMMPHPVPGQYCMPSEAYNQYAAQMHYQQQPGFPGFAQTPPPGLPPQAPFGTQVMPGHHDVAPDNMIPYGQRLPSFESNPFTDRTNGYTDYHELNDGPVYTESNMYGGKRGNRRSSMSSRGATYRGRGRGGRGRGSKRRNSFTESRDRVGIMDEKFFHKPVIDHGPGPGFGAPIRGRRESLVQEKTWRSDSDRPQAYYNNNNNYGTDPRLPGFGAPLQESGIFPPGFNAQHKVHGQIGGHPVQDSRSPIMPHQNIRPTSSHYSHSLEHRVPISAASRALSSSHTSMQSPAMSASVPTTETGPFEVGEDCVNKDHIGVNRREVTKLIVFDIPAGTPGDLITAPFLNAGIPVVEMHPCMPKSIYARADRICAFVMFENHLDARRGLKLKGTETSFAQKLNIEVAREYWDPTHERFQARYGDARNPRAPANVRNAIDQTVARDNSNNSTLRLVQEPNSDRHLQSVIVPPGQGPRSTASRPRKDDGEPQSHRAAPGQDGARSGTSELVKSRPTSGKEADCEVEDIAPRVTDPTPNASGASTPKKNKKKPKNNTLKKKLQNMDVTVEAAVTKPVEPTAAMGDTAISFKKASEPFDSQMDKYVEVSVESKSIISEATNEDNSAAVERASAMKSVKPASDETEKTPVGSNKVLLTHPDADQTVQGPEKLENAAEGAVTNDYERAESVKSDATVVVTTQAEKPADRLDSVVQGSPDLTSETDTKQPSLEDQQDDDSFHTANNTPESEHGKGKGKLTDDTVEDASVTITPTKSAASDSPTKAIKPAPVPLMKSKPALTVPTGAAKTSAGASEAGTTPIPAEQQTASGPSVPPTPLTGFHTAPSTPALPSASAEPLSTDKPAVAKKAERADKAEKAKGPAQTESLSLFGKKQALKKKPAKGKASMKGKPKEMSLGLSSEQSSRRVSDASAPTLKSSDQMTSNVGADATEEPIKEAAPRPNVRLATTENTKPAVPNNENETTSPQSPSKRGGPLKFLGDLFGGTAPPPVPTFKDSAAAEIDDKSTLTPVKAQDPSTIKTEPGGEAIVSPKQDNTASANVKDDDESTEQSAVAIKEAVSAHEPDAKIDDGDIVTVTQDVRPDGPEEDGDSDHPAVGLGISEDVKPDETGGDTPNGKKKKKRPKSKKKKTTGTDDFLKALEAASGAATTEDGDMDQRPAFSEPVKGHGFTDFEGLGPVSNALDRLEQEADELSDASSQTMGRPTPPVTPQQKGTPSKKQLTELANRGSQHLVGPAPPRNKNKRRISTRPSTVDLIKKSTEEELIYAAKKGEGMPGHMLQAIKTAHEAGERILVYNPFLWVKLCSSGGEGNLTEFLNNYTSAERDVNITAANKGDSEQISELRILPKEERDRVERVIGQKLHEGCILVPALIFFTDDVEIPPEEKTKNEKTNKTEEKAHENAE